MKSKFNIVLLILVLMTLLSACSANKINSTANSGEPSSSQITDTSKSDSAISTSTPEDDPLSEATDNQKSYYGKWVVQEVLAYGIGTYSTDDAEKLIGKSLNFSADSASVFTDQPSDTELVINNPEYRETTKSSSDFLINYRMSVDTLGIKTDDVTEVQVTGPDDVSGVFIVKDNNTIILIAGGTYFELVKQ